MALFSRRTQNTVSEELQKFQESIKINSLTQDKLGQLKSKQKNV